MGEGRKEEGGWRREDGERKRENVGERSDNGRGPTNE